MTGWLSVVDAGRGVAGPERVTPFFADQTATRRRQIPAGGTSGGGTFVMSGLVREGSEGSGSSCRVAWTRAHRRRDLAGRALRGRFRVPAGVPQPLVVAGDRARRAPP